MANNPKKHHRRSLRLKEYDYTQAGAYYITIVLQDRLCLFGEIVNTEMQLNKAGEVAHRVWEALPDRFPMITIDTFVIMPNHLHGIILINPSIPQSVGAGLVPAQDPDPQSVGAGLVPAQDPDPQSVGAGLVPAQDPDPQSVGAGLVPAQSTDSFVPAQPALGDIIGAYKSLTTVEYTRGVKTMKWTPFRRRLWQRNYYEHVIRNDDALRHIREYIIHNPGQWDFDKENPFANKNLLSSRKHHPYEV